jgi:hypothetical protein
MSHIADGFATAVALALKSAIAQASASFKA